MMKISMWFLIAGTAALFVAGCFSTDRGKPLTIVFDNARMIKAGDQVFSAGADIGDVRHVGLKGKKAAIRVVIDSRFKDAMTEGVSFSIEEGRNGKRPYLVAELPDVAGTPLADNAVIVGREPLAAQAMRDLSRFLQGLGGVRMDEEGKRAMEQFSRDLQQLRKRLQEVPPELAGRLDQLARSLDEAKKAGQAQVERYMQQVDRELAEAQRLAREMRESPEARRLRQALKDYRDRLLRSGEEK